MPSKMLPEESERGIEVLTGGPTSTTADFERQLRDALVHLNDPAHLQRHPLTRLLRHDSAPRLSNLGRALRQEILDAIESLKPIVEASHMAHASRAYQILRLRYVEGLEVSQILDRLALSKSVYYSAQQRAIEAVSAALMERWIPGGGVGLHPPTETPGESKHSQSADAKGDSAAAPRAATPTNLPVHLTSFVGREREIAEVKRLLNTTRLLTLTGTGGCGKTRLALQIAADLLDQYPDGIWLVELDSVTDPELVAQTVASALSLRDQPGRPVLDALVSYLRSRCLFIILDSCEHLLDSCAQLVERLLLACPHVRALATSREMLGVTGEAAWSVPPLETPDLHSLPPLDRLAGYEAVRLFVDRARLVQPTFELTEKNAAALAEVCSRLDGIPLAIELAAARTRGLSVEQIARHLDVRFHLLTGGSRTAPRRHQTLRATVDWSYDLLSEPEKALLRGLAVFAGGWTLDATEAVWAVDGQDAGQAEPADVLGLLLGLVDRSLVLAEPQGEETRYRLLETIRQYAWERLLDGERAEAVQRSHADHYLRLAEEASPELTGQRQKEWLDRLNVEHDNLRTALGWCLERSAEAGLRLGAALWWFWYLRGHYAEGRRWLHAFLAAGSERPDLRAQALLGSGVLALAGGDWAVARAPLEESLTIFRGLGDRAAVGQTLAYLGHVVRLQAVATTARPLLETARSMHEESLAVFREVGDRPGKGRALCELGWLSQNRDPERARAFFEEGLTSARKIGDWPTAVYTHYSLGNLLYSGGDTRQARSIWAEGVALAREIGDRVMAAWILGDIGNADTWEGDYPKARSLLEESLREIREIGDTYSLEWKLLFYGNLLRIQKDWDSARAALEECLAVSRGFGDKHASGLALASLGNLARARGEPDRARSVLRESLRTLSPSESSEEVGYALWQMGILELRQGAHARGTRLVAIGEAQDMMVTLLYSVDRAERDAALAAARASLGEDAFAQAWSEGQAMALDEAVEYALHGEA